MISERFLVVCALCSDRPGIHPHVEGRPVDPVDGHYLDERGGWVSEAAEQAERNRVSPPKPAPLPPYMRPGFQPAGPLSDETYIALGLVPPHLRRR